MADPVHLTGISDRPAGLGILSGMTDPLHAPRKNSAPGFLRPPSLRLAISLILAAAGFFLWTFRSDLLRLIAEDDDILLGRYQLEHFIWLCVGSGLLWWLAYLSAVRPKSWKKRGFRILSVVLSLGAALLVLDVTLRLVRQPDYLTTRTRQEGEWPGEGIQDLLFHRPPNMRYEVVYEDLPEAALTYPDAPRGFGKVHLSLTTDGRGFRNQSDLDRYDIVAVGDSFTEGSRISDDEAWPVLLASRLGRSVYNLGMSGTSPRVYLDQFVNLGLQLRPEIAVFMIYEGNDFREADQTGFLEGFNDSINRAVKSSPIALAIKRRMIEILGPINNDAAVPGIERLSWMPVRVRTDQGEQAYSFEPERLADLDWERDEFLRSDQWIHLSRTVESLKQVCDEQGIRLIIAFAPSKPHVILPLVAEAVPAEPLRTFASYARRGLPPAEPFKRRLFQRLSVRESVLEEFSHRQGIGFVSTTSNLREWAARGNQVYYTYDQHWTRLGHEAAAEAIARHLQVVKPPAAGR